MIRNLSITIRAQYLLAEPVDKPNATLLVGFHGYAETAEVQMQRLQALDLPKNFIRCAPEAYNRFYSRAGNVIASWMTKSFREEAIEDCVCYIDSVIEELHQNYKCSTTPILFGFSQGGALAYRYAIGGKFKSSAVIAVGSDIPPELIDQLSLLPATLICQGDKDERIPAEVFTQSVAMLQKANVAFESLKYEGGHSPTDECFKKISSFIKGL